eukprot:3387851-Rhodomonas_salina.1
MLKSLRSARRVLGNHSSRAAKPRHQSQDVVAGRAHLGRVRERGVVVEGGDDKVEDFVDRVRLVVIPQHIPHLAPHPIPSLATSLSAARVLASRLADPCAANVEANACEQLRARTAVGWKE